MATLVHFVCRNTTHLATGSRGGVGGIVMHHGTFGYCDGFASDSDHRWRSTGGVFLEQLIREESDDRSDDTRYVPHAFGSSGPLHLSR